MDAFNPYMLLVIIQTNQHNNIAVAVEPVKLHISAVFKYHIAVAQRGYNAFDTYQVIIFACYIGGNIAIHREYHNVIFRIFSPQTGKSRLRG